MKNVLIVGAGRTGRGMLGEMSFSDGWHITFCDRNEELCKGLKKQGYYTVGQTNIKTGSNKETCIKDFDVIDVRNEYEQYVKTIANSKYILTAIMPDGFEEEVKALVDAYHYRKENNINNDLFFTIGANLVGLRQEYEKLASKYFKEGESFEDNNMHMIMTVVNRKNLLPDNIDELEDKYRVIGDDKPVLRIDDDELLMSQDDYPSFFHFEHNLDGEMAIKLWTGNVVQCSMAFVAINKGIKFTNEASRDYESSMIAYYASKEAYDAVKQEYHLPDRSEEDTRYTVLLFRNNEFEDSIYRILREPIRKLKRNDRIIGPALCCLKHGILPYYITLACAYAFLYRNDEEPQTKQIEEYINANGIEEAIKHFCELNINEKDDNTIYQLVLNHYKNITKDNPIGE